MSQSAAFITPLPTMLRNSRARITPHKSRTSLPLKRIYATAAPPEQPSPEPSPEPTPASDTTLDAETRPVPLQTLKSDLYLLLSSSSIGFSAPSSQKSQISTIITSLESRNPTPDTSYSSLLLGHWRLLYTTARDVLSLSLLSPFANTGPVYQNIETSDDGDFDIENVVYFRPPFTPLIDTGTEAMLRVKAKGVVQSANRVDLTFVKAFIRQTMLAGVEIPDKLGVEIPIGGPVGYLDTTFLDEDIRIGRAPMVGDRENIFVLAREE